MEELESLENHLKEGGQAAATEKPGMEVLSPIRLNSRGNQSEEGKSIKAVAVAAAQRQWARGPGQDTGVTVESRKEQIEITQKKRSSMMT